MMLLRFLNVQGIVGLAVSIVLGVLLAIQKGETSHWKKQSAQYEQLYREQQSALSATVANYGAAAEQARASDEANAKRVADQQRAINERIDHDFEARLAAARLSAQRLREQAGSAAADPRARGSTPLPGLSPAPGGSPEAAGQDRLPQPDALTATEQAIQLDELIKWVRRQAAIDPNQQDN